MKINYNVSAAIASNALSLSENRLADSLGKLSSGLKIVNAKDNPSGLAMANRMNVQIEGIGKATQNAGDAVSVIEIADGALSEIHNMLQRINELSLKASTGTLSDADREIVDEEVQQLKEEITRIATDTEFNGQPILDGSFDLRGYTNNSQANVAYYSDQAKPGHYEINALNITRNGSEIDLAATSASFVKGVGFPADAAVTKVDGDIISITGSNGFEVKLEVKAGAASLAGLNIDLEGFGSMGTQIGANEGQQLNIRIPKISLANMGISKISTATDKSASEAIAKTSEAIKYVSSARSRLGAYQNRLESSINSLDITAENVTAAFARIMDVDMAEEMTEYTTVQVLAQAGTSMLAQANERPSQILQLLQ